MAGSGQDTLVEDTLVVGWSHKWETDDETKSQRLLLGSLETQQEEMRKALSMNMASIQGD